MIHEGNLSGANMALLEYFEVLKEMNFEIQVISPSKGSFVDQLIEKEYSVSIVPFYPWTRKLDEPHFNRGIFKRSLRNLIAAIQTIKRTKGLDAICTNTLCVNLGQLVAILSRKPHYLFVHEFGEEDHDFKLALPTRLSYRLSAFFSKAIVLNSEAIREKWRNNIGENQKLQLLYNIVNHNEPENLQGREDLKEKEVSKKLLMLGQVSPGKGHFEAVEAICKLRDEIKDVSLDIIGNAPDEMYLNSLKKYIEGINMQKYVKVLTPVPNPYKIFGRYRALLMCSRQEAFGRVTVEALKAGLPVIGRNTGGTPEIIEDGVNGFLYDDKDPDSIIDSLKNMFFIDKEGYDQLCANAELTRKKYNVEKAREQLIHIFQSDRV